ncbi:hypothetical protein Tco_0732933 [Tanacetum coccineum]
MKTPMSSDTKLTKDEECESVDSTKCRGMMGSLLYLMTSRPDIMFSVFLCARFQEAPKTSHLEAVKHAIGSWQKRPRDSNASSSSTTLNHPSSFHLLDDIVDEIDEELILSNSSFPLQNVSSSSNVVSRVLQNPPCESQHLNTYLFETINLQTQHRDDHQKGLRSTGKALKDMMSGKQK